MTTIVSSIPVHAQPQRDAAPGHWRRMYARHRYILPSILISILVCGWFATWGDGDLFYPEIFCRFYDGQARSILHGHLDVGEDAIMFEAFYRDGREYGYFGVAPALLRIPLVLLFPGMDGRWSRVFMLGACAINLLCAYRLLLRLNGNAPPESRAGRWIFSLFILCAGIGSTTVFIVSRCYTYHEAILWAATFALLCTDLLMGYLQAPRKRTLAAAGVCAFMAFHSRPTSGAGALLAIVLLTAVLVYRSVRTSPAFFRTMRMRKAACTGAEATRSFNSDPATASPFALAEVRHPWRHALVGLMAIGLTIGVYFAVNYAKFRTFEGVPVRMYGMYIRNPIRMKITGGRQFHLENLPSSIASYFCARGLRFGGEFPWVYMTNRASILGTPAIDVVEPYCSLPLCMPALALCMIAGIKPVLTGPSLWLRRVRLPALTLLVGGSVVLITVGITQRYLHDFYPAVIVLGAAGACRLAAAPRGRILLPLLPGLAVISIFLNCAFALEFQRDYVWGVPRAKQQELLNARRYFDRLCGRPPCVARLEE